MELTVEPTAGERTQGVSSLTKTWAGESGNREKWYSTLLLTKHFQLYNLSDPHRNLVGIILILQRNLQLTLFNELSQISSTYKW